MQPCPEMKERNERPMLVQIYAKNEPLAKCDLLIAKEDATLTIPISAFAAIQGHPVETVLVRPGENMAMKAAVVIAKAIREACEVSSPVFVQCADKNILDGICSMDYEGPAGGPIKCVPAGTKPPAASRNRNRSSSQKTAKPAASGAARAMANAQAADAGFVPGQKPVDKPADAPCPVKDEPPAGQDEDVSALLSDPSLVQGGEIPVDPGPEPEPEKPDPAVANAPKVMSILKECGVPSGQIPGVLEALRESMDASITLPMQVKLKLARDGATGDMDPDETAKLVAPRFDELKALLKEIDDANAAKA